jgi:hypothetical protein
MIDPIKIDRNSRPTLPEEEVTVSPGRLNGAVKSCKGLPKQPIPCAPEVTVKPVRPNNDVVFV